VSPATGLRPPQTREQLRVRTGERLRHRERATLPWDFERLVLEHFPEVGQVQAFGAEQVRAAQPKAPRGSVVVAVVPEAHRYDPAGGILRPQLNAVELREIQALLDRLASPFAKVQVRNAVHEQIQVRCTLSLQPHAAEGEVLQRCQRAVNDFLCPWVAGGLDSRFGWVVRAEDIEALLRGVAGVQAVAGLSLLHLTRRDEDEPLYRLGDSARAAPPGASSGAPAGRVVVTPAVPWGLAVPMDQHHFSTTRRLDASSAVPSGIADLAIGRNFIIGDG
jgi:hypothetical protein